MEETAGEGGIGLELGDPEVWAREILAMHRDGESVARRRNRALERASQFTRVRFSSAVRQALLGSLDAGLPTKTSAELAECL